MPTYTSGLGRASAKSMKPLCGPRLNKQLERQSEQAEAQGIEEELAAQLDEE